MNIQTSLTRNIVFSFLLIFPLVNLAKPPFDFLGTKPDKPPFAIHKTGAFNSGRLPSYLDGLVVPKMGIIIYE